MPLPSALFFDAVGTLLFPDPPATAMYARVAARFGSRLTVEEVTQRFRTAFQREDELDGQNRLQTSEDREVERWRHIVAAVLHDVDHAEECFQELFQHFARPEAWRCEEGTAAVLRELERRGHILGMASNYDRRLRSVVAGRLELQPIRHLIISSEVGWRKPTAEFFQALCRTVCTPPGEVVLVGDDLVNDMEGGRAAGLAVILFDPHHRTPAFAGTRITQLRQLLDVRP